jgi:hypothetical protein
MKLVMRFGAALSIAALSACSVTEQDNSAEGVDAIVSQLEGKAVAAGEDAPPASRSSEFIPAPDMPLHEKVLFGAFIFGIIGLFTFLGIVTPGMGWFLYFFLIPFWAMFPVAIFGSHITFYILIAYLVGFPVVTLDDVSVLDANVTWRLAGAHEVGVAINNLFDSYYLETLGYPLLGASFRAFYRMGF